MEEPQSFIYSGIKVIILKGEEFTKNELNIRFKKLDIDIDINKNTKTFLADLYDKVIEDDSNKIKIFDMLRRDTAKVELLNNRNKNIENNKKILTLNKEDLETPVNNKNSKNLIIKNEIIDEKQLNSMNKMNNIINNNSQNKKDIDESINLIRENENNDKNKLIEMIPQNNNNYNNRRNQISMDDIISTINIMKNSSRTNFNNINDIYEKNEPDRNKSFFIQVHNNFTNPNNLSNNNKNSRVYIDDDINKNRNLSTKKIILQIMLSLLALLFFYLIFHSHTIRDSFLTQNQSLIDLISSMIILFIIIFVIVLFNSPKFILSLIFTFIKNSWILFFYLICKCKKKNEFKLLSLKMFEDIKEILKNKSDRCMSENEIIFLISRKYFIDKETIILDYLQELNQLRIKDGSIKLFQDYNNKGDRETYWEFSGKE